MEVQQNCYFNDQGKLSSLERYWSYRRWRGTLYVHPKTGLLRWLEPLPRSARASTPAGENVCEINSNIYRKSHGIWYQIDTRSISLAEYHANFPGETIQLPGRRNYSVLKQTQLGRKSLMSLGLLNDSPTD